MSGLVRACQVQREVRHALPRTISAPVRRKKRKQRGVFDAATLGEMCRMRGDARVSILHRQGAFSVLWQQVRELHATCSPLTALRRHACANKCMYMYIRYKTPPRPTDPGFTFSGRLRFPVHSCLQSGRRRSIRPTKIRQISKKLGHFYRAGGLSVGRRRDARNRWSYSLELFLLFHLTSGSPRGRSGRRR